MRRKGRLRFQRANRLRRVLGMTRQVGVVLTLEGDCMLLPTGKAVYLCEGVGLPQIEDSHSHCQDGVSRSSPFLFLGKTSSQSSRYILIT